MADESKEEYLGNNYLDRAYPIDHGLIPFDEAIRSSMVSSELWDIYFAEYKGMPLIVTNSGHLFDAERIDAAIKDAKKFLEVVEKYKMFLSAQKPGFADRFYTHKMNVMYRREHISYKKREKEKKALEKPKGFVYVMIDTATGYYKIGYSKDVSHREKTLQAQKPTIDLIAQYPGNIKQEKELHVMFASQRLRGEWFSLTAEDLITIENYFAQQ